MTDTNQPTLATLQITNGRSTQEDRVVAEALAAMDKVQAKQLLAKAVSEIDQQTRHYNSGSTFTGAIITKDGDVVTAQLGDSLAFAVIYDPKTHQVQLAPLTKEHVPGIDYKRIGPDSFHFAGQHFVYYQFPSKLSGTLKSMVTSNLGTAYLGGEISKEPSLKSVNVAKFMQEGKKVFIVAASDGILLNRQKVFQADQRLIDNIMEMIHGYADNPGESCTDFLEAKHKFQVPDGLRQRLEQSTPYSLQQQLNHLKDEFAADPEMNTEKIARAIIHCAKGPKLENTDNISVAVMEAVPGQSSIAAVFDGNGADLDGTGNHKNETQELVNLAEAHMHKLIREQKEKSGGKWVSGLSAKQQDGQQQPKL
jgi:hypothetical protein